MGYYNNVNDDANDNKSARYLLLAQIPAKCQNHLFQLTSNDDANDNKSARYLLLAQIPAKY